MYRNTSMVGLKCQIKPTMMVLFMGTLKWIVYTQFLTICNRRESSTAEFSLRKSSCCPVLSMGLSVSNWAPCTFTVFPVGDFGMGWSDLRDSSRCGPLVSIIYLRILQSTLSFLIVLGKISRSPMPANRVIELLPAHPCCIFTCNLHFLHGPNIIQHHVQSQRGSAVPLQFNCKNLEQIVSKAL